ncbi:alkaline phosphatase D family protein [Microbacterium ureisolvens]|uniref:Alkaline phosphatase family protein n=1 Tax=Microbacterium ureisolvens TaxID=2781186 RepID=A0ABS7HSY6_9MICO|nr:alkaline phosphatase D family protein [Microbacterium ureisolvens]MBW9108461.1 alkaline phosphatase family protein [Microbacterium ureisolvens]
MGSPLLLGPMLRYVDETSASIWVETRADCLVSVHVGGRSWKARSFTVHGHHYALVEVDRLEPGSVSPYQVQVDGVLVWPEPASGYPAPVIATRAPGRPSRIAYGSCRTSVAHDKSGNRTHGVDSLRAFALAVADAREARPDLLIFLGDQVYADSTTKEMQAFIRARRDIRKEPGKELKDFEEYAHLYRLAWSDDANRWLLSCVPSAMIFDDHDIRDDWNASLDWKQKMEATTWWHERIVAGLASYWVYQHLGNLSPRERAADEMWQQISRRREGASLDLTAALDEFADRCDKHPNSYRWSYSRDFDDTRLIVLDSRVSRDLTPSSRGLLNGRELEWFDSRMQGGFRHVLVATSLPFLLPLGLHHVEAWDEAIAQGAWGRLAAWVGERLRRAFDLEHWAAFQNSFQAVADIATELADGERGAAPQTVTFLSGDVHFSYLAEVERQEGSRIVQAVCSPMRNPLPRFMRWFSVVMSYGAATPLGAAAAHSAKVPDPPFRWRTVKGPWFDNNLALLRDGSDGLRMTWHRGVVEDGDELHPRLEQVASITVPAVRHSTVSSSAADPSEASIRTSGE